MAELAPVMPAQECDGSLVDECLNNPGVFKFRTFFHLDHDSAEDLSPADETHYITPAKRQVILDPFTYVFGNGMEERIV